MRIAIFDIETFSLNADTGLLLCAVIKEYQTPQSRALGTLAPKVIRADSFPNWDKNRANCLPIVKAVLKELREYDIFVAHNGRFFDRSMLLAWAIKFNLPVSLRFSKFIDPCQLSRNHLKLGRNSLAKLIDWLDVPEEKTDIKWGEWMKASFNGNRRSMDYIVKHCEQDVFALELVFDRMKRLVKGIDESGSAR